MVKGMSDQLFLPFDYNSLDAETRSVVQQRTGEIKSLMRRAAQDIVDIGLKLIEVKARLGYGRFGQWLDAEFEWDIRQAQRFMTVAEQFSKCDNLSLLAPSALYLLAAPSTPEPARAEAMERAAAGEVISHAKAKEIVSEHRPAAEPVPAEAQSRASHTQSPATDEEDQEGAELPPIAPAPAAPPDRRRDIPPTPPPAAPPRPSYPHSDRLWRWLRVVQDQTIVIHQDFGGIKGLLAEPDKWDWQQVAGVILPLMETLRFTIEEFFLEIDRASEKGNGP